MLFLRRDPGWMSTRNRSPFEELNRMRREMERLTDGMNRGFAGGSHAGVFPLMNVTEDKDNYFIRAELPGMKSDEIEISVTGESLSISGERKIPAENSEAKYHRRERDSGKFSRILNLPGPVDVEKVAATSVDGLLTITLPKSEVVKPRQISVS